MNLSDALRLVKPHANTDRTLPALCDIQVKDGVATATDRYTVAEAVIEQDNPEHDGFYTPDMVKIVLAGGTVTPLPLDHHDNYPAMARLFSNVTPSNELIPSIAFNPKFLGRFAPTNLPKTLDSKQRAATSIKMTFSKDAHSPVLVEFPSVPGFRALIVPVRIASN